ncbi:MAG: hypothetical protein HY820_37770 [Acidobacteria bacterium]|nr:hypothetical protein [Acidobacteriota bacterium]
MKSKANLMGTLLLSAAMVSAQSGSPADVALRAAIELETVKGDLRGAIKRYASLAEGKDRAVAARALLRMAQCHEKLGNSEARKIYQRIVKDFGDQAELVAQARAKLGGDIASDGPRIRHFAPAGDHCMPQVLGARFTDCHRPQGYFVRDLNTGQERLVVPQSSTQGRLLPGAFSPDEKTLTYFDLSTGLRAVGVDGTGDRLLAKVGFTGGGVSLLYGLWTRDSKHLLLPLPVSETDKQTIELALVAVSDGRKQVLRRLNTGPIVDAVLSPDEKLVAFLPKPAVLDGGLLIASLTGGEPVPLTGTGPVRRLVGWHPSGHVVYTSDRTGGAMGIWAIPVAQGKASGEPRLVHANIHPSIRPWVGRDGAVHFEQWGNEPVVKAAILSAGMLTEPKPVTKLFTNGIWSPDYSRDGKKLVYATAYAPGTVRYIVQDLASGREAAYHAPFRTARNAVWYPDGSALLVHGFLQQGEQFTLYRFVPETGESKRIVDGRVEVFTVAGQDVYYRHPSDKPGTIRLLNLGSGITREITLPGSPAHIWALEVSSDGKRVAVQARSAAQGGTDPDAGTLRLTMASLSGEGQKLLLELPVPKVRGTPPMAWTPDGSALLFAAPREDGGFELRLASVNGGEPVRVYTGKEDIGRIAFHPNGRDVAISSRDRSGGTYWVIENAFASSKN